MPEMGTLPSYLLDPIAADYYGCAEGV